jgi:hypothetical protein
MGKPLRVLEIEPSKLVEEDSPRAGIYTFTIELSEREAAALTTEAPEIKVSDLLAAGTAIGKA